MPHLTSDFLGRKLGVWGLASVIWMSFFSPAAVAAGSKAAALSGALQPSQVPSGDDHPEISVMQGFTNATMTQISVVAPKALKLRFALVNIPDAVSSYKAAGNKPKLDAGPSSHTAPEILPTRYSVESRIYSDYAAHKVSFDGLKAGLRYTFQIVGSNDKVIATRTLSGLDITNTNPKIAIASCMDDSLKLEQKEMWRALLDKKPDYLFMIGDNAYVNRRNGVMINEPSPQVIWERYIESRRVLQIYYESLLTPTIATWDDNDYGENNGGVNYDHRVASQQIFRAFFAQDPVQHELESGPGISSALAVFGQKFVFLDNRTFRTEDNPKNAAKPQAHFGKAQLAWLESNLVDDSFVWLISGDQFFGKHHPYESFEGNHPEAFSKFLSRARQIKAAILFVSGDRHLAELLSIEKKVLGYQTYEITTSPLHAKTYKGTLKKYFRKDTVAGIDGTLNFAIIEPKINGNGLNLSVGVYGVGGKTLFSHSLSVRKP